MLQHVIHAQGLSGFTTTVIDNWLGPVFILGIAAFAIMFIKNRQWTQLISFVGIAAVVGVLIFAGASFFGKDGNLTTAAEDVGRSVNGTIDLGSLVDAVKIQIGLLR